MENLEINNAVTDIMCTIGWYDSPDSSEDVVIAITNQDEEPYPDNDEKIFYYLNPEDVESLNTAIRLKKDTWACTNEWFIDLVEGLIYVVA